MKTSDFLREVIEHSGYQAAKVFEGLADKDYDYKVCRSAMSPRETLIHLAEVCEAYIAEATGQKYSWGSYKPADTSVSALNAAYRSFREKAVQTAVSATNEDAMLLAAKFIASHEAYHVGQMCLARMELDPSWNAYSIYKGM